MPFHATILTLYPQMFPGHLAHSMAGRGLKDNIWSLDCLNIRDFATDRHKSVDDTPAGGGAGMVLRADVLARALDSVGDERPRFLLSPRGQRFSQKEAHALAKSDGVVLVCGRFEGVDQRVIEKRNLVEISIGDYILSGGESAALVMLDAIVRLLPGIMGNQQSACQESFENFLLEHPQYTRPQSFEGAEIPAILTSGNHALIKKWQLDQALELTKQRRPDLYQAYLAATQKG